MADDNNNNNNSNFNTFAGITSENGQQPQQQIILFADFDSSNMARYERVKVNSQQQPQAQQQDTTAVSASTNQQPQNEVVDQNKHIEHQKFDAEFNVWTRNDCQGTQYSNGNRTWFYFGVKGGHGKWVKFNIMNLNRQGKLFEMGMLPVFKTVPGHEKWSRIYSRPTWQNVEQNFQMSFCFHLPDRKTTITYFAFCFPFSYEDCQNQLARFDKEFEYCKYVTAQKFDPDAIYYHRELFCYSLDNRRVDLLTITACNNTNFKREPRFDKSLFPDRNNPRPYNFNKKRVFILTSRVHPGETPASFVFNGFLEFILNKDDPRAKALRKNFVFKLIPLLNPDGVARGHYRTDQLGMNLNRVYLDPSFSLHPSIYAAKSLVVFHHIMNRTTKDTDGLNFNGIFDLRYDRDADENLEKDFDAFDKTQTNIEVDNEFEHDNESLIEHSIMQDLNEASRIVTPRSLLLLSASSSKRNTLTMTHAERIDELSLEESQHRNSARSNKILLAPINNKATTDIGSEPYIGNENSDEEDENAFYNDSKEPNSPHLNDPRLLAVNPLATGIAFYVDLHGHAAKRGCFIYGNALENETHQIENVLFTKLIAVNSQHFDFDGCNFSLKNMYYKDKREGLSKEGSGRVALYKTIGLIHSYTLECNYACGRVMNTMAPAANSSLYGRISPPQHTELPPKFLPEHFHSVGKGLAIAALDITELNPCSRVSNTTFGSLDAVRNWVKFFIRTKTNSKTNVNGDTKRASLTNNIRTQQTVSNNTNNVRNTTSESRQYGGGVRRNTAPTNNNSSNNYENNNNKRFTTQFSTPANGYYPKTPVTPLRDVRFNKNNVASVRRNMSLSEQPRQTPLLESKNFIRKNQEINKLAVKSTPSNANDDEQDFKEFNNYIAEKYIEDKEDIEELIAIENGQDVFDANKSHPKITDETSWFLSGEDKNVLQNNNDLFLLSKPNSRLQRLSNNISKGYSNAVTPPVRELFPMNRAVVLHAGSSMDTMPQQQQMTQNNVSSESVSNTQVANAVAIAKQYLSRGGMNMNAQFYHKQQQQKKFGNGGGGGGAKPSQTIKAIYNTNLIKKFLNTKKIQLSGGKNEIKVLASTLLQQQQQQQPQLLRSTSQIQRDESILFENIDNSKGKKKGLIEYKTKLSNKKAVHQTPASQSSQAIDHQNEQFYENNRKMKRRHLRENARKLKLSLPNIEHQFDSSVKLNEVDDVSAFWIDL